MNKIKFSKKRIDETNHRKLFNSNTKFLLQDEYLHLFKSSIILSLQTKKRICLIGIAIPISNNNYKIVLSPLLPRDGDLSYGDKYFQIAHEIKENMYMLDSTLQKWNRLTRDGVGPATHECLRYRYNSGKQLCIEDLKNCMGWTFIINGYDITFDCKSSSMNSFYDVMNDSKLPLEVKIEEMNKQNKNSYIGFKHLKYCSNMDSDIIIKLFRYSIRLF